MYLIAVVGGAVVRQLFLVNSGGAALPGEVTDGAETPVSSRRRSRIRRRRSQEPWPRVAVARLVMNKATSRGAARQLGRRSRQPKRHMARDDVSFSALREMLGNSLKWWQWLLASSCQNCAGPEAGR
jgi:hypothetical protein